MPVIEGLEPPHPQQFIKTANHPKCAFISIGPSKLLKLLRRHPRICLNVVRALYKFCRIEIEIEEN